MKAIKSSNILLLMSLGFGLPLFISLNAIQDSRLKGKGNSSDLSLKIQYLRKAYQVLPWSDDGEKIFRIETQLINHSEDSISFISMTCSFQDMYVVNPSDSFSVYPDYHCESNYPIVVKLAPKEAYIREIVVKTLLPKRIESYSLKIGFLLVPPKKINSTNDLFKELNTRSAKTPIWSNEIELSWD